MHLETRLECQQCWDACSVSDVLAAFHHKGAYICCKSHPEIDICCVQMLEGGALKPLAEHLNGQQLTWLQALVAGKAPEARAAEATELACFLAGCSPQGFRCTPAYYGCLAAHMPVQCFPLMAGLATDAGMDCIRSFAWMLVAGDLLRLPSCVYYIAASACHDTVPDAAVIGVS